MLSHTAEYQRLIVKSEVCIHIHQDCQHNLENIS